MLEDLTATSFQPHVGEVFRLRIDDDTAFDTELVDVTEGERPGRGRQPFTLLFRGPAEPILAQRIYTFEHDALGNLEIFVVPVGADADGVGYEAVFT